MRFLSNTVHLHKGQIVGHFLTANDVRTRFAELLIELAQAFRETCEQWERAHQTGFIVREDLFLNEATAELGLGTLRKLQRETAGKLEDAIAGIYRYRLRERVQTARERKRRK